MSVIEGYLSFVDKAADKLNEFDGVARLGVAFGTAAGAGLVMMILPDPTWSLAGVFGFAVAAMTGFTGAQIAINSAEKRNGDSGWPYTKDLLITIAAMLGGVAAMDIIIPNGDEPEAETLGAIVQPASAEELASPMQSYTFAPA